MRLRTRFSSRFLAPLALLAALMLVPALPARADQPVSCPEAGLSMVLPDSFEPIAFSPEEDPDLRQFWRSGSLDMTVYVSWVGPTVHLDDLLQVLTGNEDEYGTVLLDGQEALYAAGTDGSEAYRMYTWIYQNSSVTLWFCWDPENRRAEQVIDDITSTLILSLD